jgi:hypothetical protein
VWCKSHVVAPDGKASKRERTRLRVLSMRGIGAVAIIAAALEVASRDQIQLLRTLPEIQ